MKANAKLKGTSMLMRAFAENAVLHDMRETDYKSNAEKFLLTARNLEFSNYNEIEQIYHKKFPTENKTS